MLKKGNFESDGLDKSSVEELAELLFEIGHSQNKKTQWAEAIYWLERAHNIFLSQSQDMLSGDAGELRIAILHDMARALLYHDTDDSHTRARNIVRELGIDCGDRLVILILKLDILATDASHSTQDYCDILHKIVRLVQLTEANVKTVLYYMHKLRSRSPLMAHRVLFTFLSERLLGAEETKWIEKALIIIIWNCTNSTDFLNAMTSLSEVFDTLNDGAIQALSPYTTHAAQIVRPLKHLHSSF